MLKDLGLGGLCKDSACVQYDVLTLTVIKLAKPDDCPPQLCVLFSL